MERGKVLAGCGLYLMNFLVLRMFDVLLERSFIGKNGLNRYLKCTLNCLPKGDFKLGFQEHPCSCCDFGWSALPSWTGCLREGHLCRERRVFRARRVLSKSHEKCRSDDSDLG